MFFIVYAYKGQLPVFAGLVKIVSLSSCRTSAILKYFCPLCGVDFMIAMLIFMLAMLSFMLVFLE